MVRWLDRFGSRGGSAAATITVMRDTPAEREMLYGIVTLIVGLAVTVAAVGAMSTPVFYIGTIVAGSGFGAGFQGAIRTVAPLPAPHERAGVLSVLYVISYLAMGLPAIGAGVLVVEDGSVTTTARYYGLALIALTAVAGAALLRGRRGRGLAFAPRNG